LKHASTTIDIFGKRWTVTRRVDSGYGFDLLYGADPERAGWRAPPHHILDEALRSFVLAHLDGFVQLPVPITSKRRAVLRRIVSSLRYASIEAWIATRAPDEPTLWLHPDHIPVPTLHDIDGLSFEPSAVTMTRDGLRIYTGIPDKPRPGARHRQAQYVLTPDVAAYLDQRRGASTTDLEAALAPISRPLIVRWQRRTNALLAPDLQRWKELPAAGEALPKQMHADYIAGGRILDARGRLCEIVTVERMPCGILHLRGRPIDGPRRKKGVEVIITQELAALVDRHVYHGGLRDLRTATGLKTDTIRRIRTDLKTEMPCPPSP